MTTPALTFRQFLAATPVQTAGVVVTATKRVISLQKTAIAVTVIGGSALEDAHLNTILATAQYAPPRTFGVNVGTDF